MRLHRTGSALLALAFASAPVPAQQEERVFWLNNYQDALQEARKTQKPIFLEFRCEA
jgi:hypothetical protein